MNSIRDVPNLVGELVDLSKQYVRGEAFGPTRSLGRVAGFSLGAGLTFAVGGVLLSVVGMRAMARALADPWDWAAYVIAGLVDGVAAGAVLWVGRR